MPQYDLYHDTVKNALIKDGWVITADPFIIEFKGVRLYADLGAEKVFAAEKSGHGIVVEIKVFNSPSLVTELEKAVGQYGIYRTFLKQVDPQRNLYLAIADDVYRDFFLRPAIQEVVTDHQIHLLIFNPEQEEILQWIH
ncbi:MAG: fatty-acid synthase [Deltaproteobacteria bacterium]|nr:fatty-acid synthase [Deltaproteobacteria bacterium]